MEYTAAKSKIKKPAFMRKKAKNEREELHQFIFDLCRRPGSHLLNGSFVEAEAMVNGYVRVVWSSSGNSSEWWGFHNWYGQNYPHLGSNSVFGKIADKYPDEPSRFRRLQFLFNKYIRETENLIEQVNVVEADASSLPKTT